MPFLSDSNKANETSTTLELNQNNSTPLATTFAYRTRTTIGYWNVRTLLDNGMQCNQNSKYLQLEGEFLRYNLNILGVSEARWLGNGSYKSPTGRSTFLFSGKEEGANHEAGVGLMLTPTAYKSLLSWNPISERFMTARFYSKVRKITIIQCYAPTELASTTEKDDFYSQL